MRQTRNIRKLPNEFAKVTVVWTNTRLLRGDNWTGENAVKSNIVVFTEISYLDVVFFLNAMLQWPQLWYISIKYEVKIFES